MKLTKIVAGGDSIGKFKVQKPFIGKEALEAVRNSLGQIIGHKLVFSLYYQGFLGAGIYEATLPY
jgi:hypothetical protein